MHPPWIAWYNDMERFDEWGMVAGAMEVLLMIHGFENWIQMYVDIKEGDMGSGNGPGELDSVTTVGMLKEIEK